MSVLLDRASSRNVIIYSTEGGMDIEEVSEHHPEKIHKEFIDPKVGLQAFQARKIAFNLGLSGNALKEMVKLVELFPATVEDGFAVTEKSAAFAPVICMLPIFKVAVPVFSMTNDLVTGTVK
jgi:succinyl-CoA synthetase beta subunit